MQKGVVRKRRTPPLSEYGKQLHEKQELKTQYNMRERQFQNYVEKTLEAGIRFAVKQCRELLEGGASGIHFYTLNKTLPVERVLQSLLNQKVKLGKR